MIFVPSIMEINSMTVASAVATVASNAVRAGATTTKKEDDMENELHNPAGEHPAPKRKVAKRRKRRAAPRVKVAPKATAAPATKPSEFDGISQSDCPFDCDPEKCAITGIGVCGHPYKGGLQSALLSKPDVVRRYQAARRIIAHQVTDKKG